MTSSLPRHASNPLDLPGDGKYHDLCRDDIIQLAIQLNLRADRVIEIGCGTGKTGEKLKLTIGAGFYMGIELDAVASEKAAARLDVVRCADLDAQSPVDLGLTEDRFDLLVALDVLEHLYDPWKVLAQWGSLVTSGGYLLTSIPNIAHFGVIAGMASGRFDYAAWGLLDATHIRFFSAASIESLLKGANFTPCQVSRSTSADIDIAALMPMGNTIRSDRLTISNLTRDEAIALCTVQYLVLAKKSEQKDA